MNWIAVETRHITNVINLERITDIEIMWNGAGETARLRVDVNFGGSYGGWENGEMFSHALTFHGDDARLFLVRFAHATGRDLEQPPKLKLPDDAENGGAS